MRNFNVKYYENHLWTETELCVSTLEMSSLRSFFCSSLALTNWSLTKRLFLCRDSPNSVEFSLSRFCTFFQKALLFSSDTMSLSLRDFWFTNRSTRDVSGNSFLGTFMDTVRDFVILQFLFVRDLFTVLLRPSAQFSFTALNTLISFSFSFLFLLFSFSLWFWSFSLFSLFSLFLLFFFSSMSFLFS